MIKMEHLLQWILFSLAATASLTTGCPGDRPMKPLICHQTGPLSEKFDPCLCTHLVLHKELHQLTSGDAKKAVIDYKAINPSLQVLGSWSPDGQVDLEPSKLAKTTNSLELDGIFLKSASDSTTPSAKDKLINLVKVLATELDSLKSSKRAYENYEPTEKKSIHERVKDSGIMVQLPSNPQALGKHYDLKKLTKYVDYYVIATENITDASENGLSYHPSRLMGIDDVLNADSLLDLVSGLGAPLDKLVVSLPSSVFTFTLENSDDNMPRSKVSGQPKKISQAELCSMMEEGGWTVERDEDLTAPYAYRNKSWIAFDDTTSAAIKGKYILLRDLAGAAVDSIQMEDWEGKCKETPGGVIKTLYETFTTIARKPRAAQLLALQEQIHDAYNVPFSDVQLSPYRIVRVVDRAGSIHVVRKEAKTEFSCSRQGYFTHPSGCNRFYRCVKFNQYSSDFTVFEYDCPAGLAFDERYEVCVWPGSLPDANACKGSSEIAPVPRARYSCPSVEGYYADPENCRWFFACLDHRQDGSELTAYEFRCPFGLVFNEKNLVCDWPWYVDGCGSGAGVSSIGTGFVSADILEGRLRPSFAQIPDVHVSGGRIENVAGGYILDSSLNSGLPGIQGRGYYRGESSNINAGHLGVHGNIVPSGNILGGSGDVRYQSGVLNGLNKEDIDNSGAYIHDPTGDHGGDYIHQEGPGSNYVAGVNLGASSLGLKSTSGIGVTAGLANLDHSDAYIHDSTGDRGGDYIHQDGPGSTYISGANKGLGYVSSSNIGGNIAPGIGVTIKQASLDNSGAYLHDSTGDHGVGYTHQEGPGSTYVSGINQGYIDSSGGKVASGLGVTVGLANLDNSGAYVHDSTGDHGEGYVHQEGPGSTYVSGINQDYVGSSGGKIASGLGVTVGVANLDNSGAYVHHSTGDHGKGYVHQEGPGSTYVSGINQGYVGSSGGKIASGLGVTVGVANLDNSGAYVHDTTGDQGGDYVHQEGPGSPYVASVSKGVGYVGSSTIGGKVAPSLGVTVGIANQDNSGAYVHDSTGDRGVGYIHQAGPGSTYVSGVNEGYIGLSGERVSSGLGVTGGQANIDNSGAYIHDSTGDHGVGYVHKEGHGSAYVSGTNKNYVGSSGENAAPALGVTVGLANLENSGTYVHDLTGDHGGDYIHQEGPGSAYTLEKNKGSVYVGVSQGPSYISSSPIGLKAQPALGVTLGQTNFENSGSKVLVNSGNIQGPINAIHSSNVISSTAFGQKTVPSVGVSLNQIGVDNSGAYVHDTTGDRAPEYVHQEIKDGGYVHVGGNEALYKGGFSTSGSYVHDTRGGFGGDYVHQSERDGGYVHTGGNYVYSNLNTGIKGDGYNRNQGVSYTKFTSKPGSGLHIGASLDGNDGQYIHDPTGDRAEGYIHQEGPQGLGYVHDHSGEYVAGLYSGKAVNEGAYYAGAYKDGAYFHDNSGAYIHDNSGEYVSVHHAPKVYSTGSFTVGKQEHYAGGYGAYVQPGLSVPNNAYTYINTQKSGNYPSHSFTHVQPVNYEGIGGTIISNVGSSGSLGIKTASPSYVSVSTPKPVSYYSTAGVPISSTLHSGSSFHVSQPTATVSPIVVSSTPAVPLNPVQYSTVTQKPILSFAQIKPSLQTYSVSSSSLPVINHSYKQPVNTFTVTGSQTVPVANIPVTTPIPPVSRINFYKESSVVPASVSYVQPQAVVQPVTIVKTPVAPLNPIQYVKPIVTPAPAVISSYHEPSIKVQDQNSYFKHHSYNTYVQPAVVKTTYQKPAPVVHNIYQEQTLLQPLPEQKVLEPVVVSSTVSTPIEPVRIVHTVKPIVISTPAPFRTHFESKVVANAPVNSVQYVQPIISTTPSSPVVNYNFKSPSLLHTKLEPAQKPIVPKEIFSYSYQQQPAIKTDYVQPISVSTTPVVPLNPIQYVKPAPFAKVDYTYQQSVPVVSTYENVKPAVISYPQYQQPIVETKFVEQRPLKVEFVTTPAPTVFQKIDSVGHCANCVSPSLSIKSEKTFVQPISVSTTPIVPLAPVQYVKPVQGSGISSFSYSYQQPTIRPVSTLEEQTKEIYKTYVSNREYLPPLPSTPAPPSVSYTYEGERKEVNNYVKKPFAGPAYLPPVATVTSTYAPPIDSYSYEQEPLRNVAVEKQTFGSKVVLPPVTPIVSTPSPASPVFSYSYEQRPAVKSEYVRPQPVAPPSSPYIPLNVNGDVLYGRPVPVKGCTVCSLVDSENVKPVPVYNQYQSGYNSYSYQPVKTAPSYQFQPDTYVQTNIKPIAPAYEYKQPVYQVPLAKQENIPAKPCLTCSNSQSASISVTSTPVVPFNTIQYVTTPAPVIKQTPVVRLEQNIQPVINQFEYQKPSVQLYDQKIVQQTVKTPVRPVVNYNYQKTVEKVQPISVSTTPLNKIHYITTSTPYVKLTTPEPAVFTDTHFYEFSKVSQAPAVFSNQPVAVTSTVRPTSGASFEVYNRQPNVAYTKTRLSSPAPFRPQYTASVTQSPVTLGVIKEQPTPVFEEYFGIDKNNVGSLHVGQVSFTPQVKEHVRVPVVSYSTPAPTLETVKLNLNTRVPTNQYQYFTTVAPTTPEPVKYTIRYRKPTTIVSQPIQETHQYQIDNVDENLNAHIDIAKINLDSREQYYIPTSTFAPSTITVGPTIKRVKVDGGQGYYVRKQKVKVRPVTTVTENYPSFYTTTYKPLVYSTSLDLTSPTFYTTTVRPVITSSVSSAELDIETSQEDDSKLFDEVSGNFGEVINAGAKGVIEQNNNGFVGLSSTTVASLKDGEAIVGVIKKTRISQDGRKKAKVVVVSRLSDFNPILVGKLGAQCSCQNEGQPDNLRRVAVKRVKGRLFNPQSTTANYLSSASQGYLSSSGTTAIPLNSYEPVVEIKPFRKIQRTYVTSTALPLDGDYAASIDSAYVTQIPSRVRTGGRKQVLKYQSSSEVNSIETETKIVSSGVPTGDTVDLVRGTVECQRAGLFRHPKHCNKFYSCNWDQWKKKFTLSVFNCPIHLAYDSNLGACNWPSKGPACSDDNLLV